MEKGLKKALAIYNERKEFLKMIYTHNEKIELQFYKELLDYNNFKEVLSNEDFQKVIRYKRNRNNRRRRANKKLLPILFEYNPKIIFGTCTFNDMQFLKKNGKEIKEITRTKKVNKWIENHFKYAVVNIDYGKKTEREHHHFVGVLKEDEELELVEGKSKTGHEMYELVNKDYNLGFEPTLEIVKYNPLDYKMKRISNYLLKINNHENKETTKNRRFRVLGAMSF